MFTHSKTGAAWRQAALAAALMAAAACALAAAAEQPPAGPFKEPGEDQLVVGVAAGRASGAPAALRQNSRLLAVPLSLARFMFPNGRPGPAAERPSQAALASFGPGNNKRSSSEFDVFTGMSGVGKRSVPAEYINLEPIFRSQSLSRGPARVHDMRWAPLEAVDVPLMGGDF